MQPIDWERLEDLISAELYTSTIDGKGYSLSTCDRLADFAVDALKGYIAVVLEGGPTK